MTLDTAPDPIPDLEKSPTHSALSHSGGTNSDIDASQEHMEQTGTALDEMNQDATTSASESLQHSYLSNAMIHQHVEPRITAAALEDASQNENSPCAIPHQKPNDTRTVRFSSTEPEEESLAPSFHPPIIRSHAERTKANGVGRRRSISMKVDVMRPPHSARSPLTLTDSPTTYSPKSSTRKRSFTRIAASPRLASQNSPPPSPQMRDIIERNKSMLEGVHIFLGDDHENVEGFKSIDFSGASESPRRLSSSLSATRLAARSKKTKVLRSELSSLFKTFETKQKRIRELAWKKEKRHLFSMDSSGNLFNTAPSHNAQRAEAKPQSTRILSKLTDLSSALRKYRLKEVAQGDTGTAKGAARFLPHELIASIANTLREVDHFLAENFEYSRGANGTKKPPTFSQKDFDRRAFLLAVLRRVVSFVSLVGKIFTLQMWIVHIVTGILRLDRQLTRQQRVETPRSSELPSSKRAGLKSLISPRSPPSSAQSTPPPVFSSTSDNSDKFDFLTMQSPMSSRSESFDLQLQSANTTTDTFILYKYFIIFSFRNVNWAGEEGFRCYFELLLYFMVTFIWESADDRPHTVFVPPKSTSAQVMQYNEYLVYGRKADGDLHKELPNLEVQIPIPSTLHSHAPEASRTVIFHDCSSKVHSKRDFYHNAGAFEGRRADRYRLMKQLKCNCAREMTANAEFGLKFVFKHGKKIQHIIHEYMWRKEGAAVCRHALLLLCSCFLYNQTFAKKAQFKASILQNEHMIWMLMKFFTEDWELVYYSLLLINTFIEENEYSCTTRLKNTITENMKSNQLFFIENVLLKIPLRTDEPLIQATQHEMFKFLLYMCNKNAPCKQFLLSLPNRDEIQSRVESMIHRNRSLGSHRRNVALEVSSVEFWAVIRKPAIACEDLWPGESGKKDTRFRVCSIQ